jgi:hypothetical protein
VDLPGNISLPGAVLAQYQDRAVGFGNPGNRALHPRLGKRDRFRLALPILDHCNYCHKGSEIHFLFCNAASKPD